MKRLLKSLLLGLGVFSTLFVVIGVFLPRKWKVESTVEVAADQIPFYFSSVVNFQNWKSWAIWGMDDPTYEVNFSENMSVPGSWMKWTSKKSGYGQLTLTQIEPLALVRYDSQIESAQKNGSGEFRFETKPGDPLRGTISWIDEGELPPIVGGYFKSMVEASLKDHFQKSLEKLTAQR
jgi:hypothetical protein